MKTQKKWRVGIIGCGFIGTYLYKRLQEVPFVDIAFLYSRNSDSARRLNEDLAISHLNQAGKTAPDLVVEAATADAVREYASGVLTYADMLILSITSLADISLKEDLEKKCQIYGHRLYVPHGAVIGLDGLYDANEILQSVTIKTMKRPRNLGSNATDRTVLYEGTTRDVCKLFPRNVNVHAAVALAGMGFDKTFSQLIADPDIKYNTHEIEAQAAGTSFRIIIESEPQSLVTGRYTPESVFQTVKRILYREPGIVLV